MFLDIALGILSSVFVNKIFHMDLAWYLVLAGIGFALLPDMDFIFYLLRGGKSDERAGIHRKLFHNPLVYIPTGMILLSFFGKEWTILFGLTSLLHFLHDTTFLGLGWGVRWFWPFSESYIMFCRIRVGNEKRFPFKILHFMSPEEMENMGLEYGDPDWVKNLYFRPSIVLITEVAFFIFSFVILYFSL